MADKKPKIKPKKKAVKKEPGKEKNLGGAPIGNTNREIYTLEVALSLFDKAKDILISDIDIITETELMVKCKYALSLPMSSYRYLSDEKFKVELADIKKEIESILESRVMKSKEMYPGIAAMTLKNKHGWKDEKQLGITAELGVKQLTDDQLVVRIRALESKIGTMLPETTEI